jgi:hypothetical protein
MEWFSLSRWKIAAIILSRIYPDGNLFPKNGVFSAEIVQYFGKIHRTGNPVSFRPGEKNIKKGLFRKETGPFL